MHAQIAAPGGTRKIATYTVASNIIVRSSTCGGLRFQGVTEETKELNKKVMLERNSLRGICRIFDISLT